MENEKHDGAAWTFLFHGLLSLDCPLISISFAQLNHIFFFIIIWVLWNICFFHSPIEKTEHVYGESERTWGKGRWLPSAFTAVVVGCKVLSGGRSPSRVPETGGKGDGWFDARLRRKKALRREGDGLDRTQKDLRFSSREDAGFRSGKARFSSNSRVGFHLCDTDDAQWGSDESEGFFDGSERRRYNREAEKARGRSRRPRRRDVFSRLGRAGVRSRQRVSTESFEQSVRPKFRRFVTFYFTNFPP